MTESDEVRLKRHDRATRCRTRQSRHQRLALAKRQQVRIGWSERRIRRIHPPSSVGDSMRSRNNASGWKDHAGSPDSGGANMPSRVRGRAVQCHSPTQTSFCELTSHLSRYLVVLSDRMLSLALGGCSNPASSAALQASLRLALFSLRQIAISSALGMNGLQSVKTSGVHAKRCSGVSCEEKARVGAVDRNATDTHNCAKGIGRSSLIVGLSMIM
jgi:hypothetical protein